MALTKTVVVPQTSKTLEIDGLYVRASQKTIQVFLTDGTAHTFGADDYDELIGMDVGTLLGVASKGITVGQIASRMALGIAVHKAKESMGDWK